MRSGLTSVACLLGLGLALSISNTSLAAPPTEVDKRLAKENTGRQLNQADVIDDLAFLRRVTVDLLGRIPTEPEIQEYQALPAGQRRDKWVDRLLKDDQFAYRWTAFYGDMLRLRSNAEGGAAMTAYVMQSIRDGKPYDELCRELISASGKAGKTPAVGFVLGDAADPMALAGVTSQVFMGVRIACAQCHDHPFDVWTREQFHGLAAYYGKTRRVESELTRSIYTQEQNENVVVWPPIDVMDAVERKPMNPAFPFAMDKTDGPHIKRMIALREALKKKEQKAPEVATVDDLLSAADDKVANRVGNKGNDVFDVAGEAKQDARNLNVQNGMYSASQLRQKLAELVTSPRNRYFSQAFVNRLWAELLGRGIVEPVDDFSDTNPPSHPETLAYLADEFVASGYDLRTAVRMIVTSQAYQRAHLRGVGEAERIEAEEAFVASPVRRMISEAMYDSIVLAGHVFDHKHPAGQNLVTDWRYQRVAIENKTTTRPLASIGKPAPTANMTGPKMAANGEEKGPSYDLESAIELDFDKLLKPQEEVKIDAMAKMSNEEIEAMRMAEETQRDYLDRFVKVTFDDNPSFSSALKMASPAPVNHFLRVFGQPGRSDLGDFRDDSASMRQSLMMLNGRLTHEAARVGELEPVYAMLVGEKADLDKAIKFVYREILTREPSAEDIALGRELLRDAESPREGMADLRWVLFNSHEFRFLP